MSEAGSPIHVRLLGRFDAARDAQFADRIRFSTKKVAALLAFLAMNPQQAATREQLGALLWGNSPDAQARQSLRQALLFLRKDLHPAEVVDAGAEVVRLRPGAVSVDAPELDALSASDDFADLERAAALVQGEFLAGFALEEEPFEDWLRQQRRRFEVAGTGALERHARECDALGKGAQATATVERLLALDPLREDWQRLALRLYARHRSHNEAMAQAKAFTHLLKRELDVEPEPQTQALIEEIRRSAVAQARTVPEAEPAEAPREVTAIPSFHSTPLAQAAAEALATTGAASPPPPPSRPQSLSHPLLQFPRSPRWQPRRGIAVTGLAATTLLLAASILGLAHMRTAALNVKGVPSKPANEAPAPSADPWRSPRQPATGKLIIPVLVLPFKTYADAAGSTQLLADMMSDDLINMLSRVSSFRVISRQTSRSYQGQPIDIAVIGAELGVRYVLEGSVRLLGGMMRVNVELIDPATRLPVWSGRIEREGADRNGVLDEIVGRLARELQFEILPIESERLSKNAHADALAYRGYAALSAALTQISLDAYKPALSLLHQALEQDPEHPLALLGLAGYHANVGAQRLDGEFRAHSQKAIEIARHAIGRRPRNGLAHFYMGIALQTVGRLPEAIEHFERAVEFNPSHAPAHAHIGHALARSARAAVGLEHIRYAMRLSPRDPALAIWLEFAGTAELELNHHAQAVENYRRSAAMTPGYPRPWAGLAAAHALSGNGKEARIHAEKLKVLAPGLDAEGLVQRFGRHKKLRLHQGLRLALDLPPS
jgi:DNA-binding SARP family transcriptional activator/TolB-like protein/Tfp pilus assembly protein PilF